MGGETDGTLWHHGCGWRLRKKHPVRVQAWGCGKGQHPKTLLEIKAQGEGSSPCGTSKDQAQWEGYCLMKQPLGCGEGRPVDS